MMKELDEKRTTSMRWAVAIIYFGNAALCSFQFGNYVMIPDIITEYFGVNINMVTWTSQIYMISFCILIFPIIWWLDFHTLRAAHLWGSGLGMVAAVFKCFVRPDLWSLQFTGQCFSSVSNIFLCIMPAVMSAVWFPESELAIASGIGAGGLILGNALGYMLPPLIVEGPKQAYGNDRYPSDWSNSIYNESAAAIEEVGQQLFALFLGQAILNVIFLTLVIVAFPAKPEFPPSISEAKMRTTEKPQITLLQSVKQCLVTIRSFLTNFNWMMLTMSGGLLVGVYYSILTLLNQIVKPSFTDQSDQNFLNIQIGKMSLWMLLAGFIASFITGYILDKTKKFKLITLVTTICCCGFYIVFTVLLLEGMYSNDTVL